jgi:hypothetical protein
MLPSTFSKLTTILVTAMPHSEEYSTSRGASPLGTLTDQPRLLSNPSSTLAPGRSGTTLYKRMDYRWDGIAKMAPASFVPQRLGSLGKSGAQGGEEGGRAEVTRGVIMSGLFPADRMHQQGHRIDTFAPPPLPLPPTTSPDPPDAASSCQAGESHTISRLQCSAGWRRGSDRPQSLGEVKARLATTPGPQGALLVR